MKGSQKRYDEQKKGQGLFDVTTKIRPLLIFWWFQDITSNDL